MDEADALYERLTVAEYLNYFADFLDAGVHLSSAMEQMHLVDLRRKKISRCSRGEKRRIAIAREITMRSLGRSWSASTRIKKDIKDCLTEKTALLMTAVPVVFALIFRLLFADGGYGDMAEWITLVCLLFNLSLLPLSVLPLLIGEEKEQGTVPTLLRAGVTPGAFLASKALTALCVELFCSILICLINGVRCRRSGKFYPRHF